MYLLKVDVAGGIAVHMLDGQTVVCPIGVRPALVSLRSGVDAAANRLAHLKMLPHSLPAAVFMVTWRKTESVLLSRMVYA